MHLLHEIQQYGIPVMTKAQIFCKAFEDNSAALEIACIPKFRPRMHHLNVIYHHFCNEVQTNKIILCPITSAKQLADAFTKQTPLKTFLTHREKIMGW